MVVVSQGLRYFAPLLSTHGPCDMSQSALQVELGERGEALDLLRNPAFVSVNAVDKFEKTALHYAVQEAPWL